MSFVYKRSGSPFSKKPIIQQRSVIIRSFIKTKPQRNIHHRANSFNQFFRSDFSSKRNLSQNFRVKQVRKPCLLREIKNSAISIERLACVPRYKKLSVPNMKEIEIPVQDENTIENETLITESPSPQYKPKYFFHN